MKLSRRSILLGVGSLPFAVASLRTGALAQTVPAAQTAEVPPVLFVHGNGEYDALWMTTLWRMESNGVARDRMMAINFTDPNARSDDKVEQAGRSSTEDQRRELAAAIAELKRRAGAARVALVGSSRGGYAIRNVIRNGGAGDVSHAVLCGTPNHGVFATDDQPNNEFNGRGTFLRGLNEGESEVTPGVAFLTLRSDGMDKYAQADGRFIGKPGTPTGVTVEGPELKGATNLVLGALDHREVAFHPRAFREIYKFIAGREPARIAIVPEQSVSLSGLVTGTPGGVSTNRPVAGATVDVFRVDPDTGGAQRQRGAQREDRRRRPLGSGAGRAFLVPRIRPDIAGRADDAYLPHALPALVRCRASACRAPARAGGQGCRRRRDHVTPARLFRPAAGRGAARRQGAGRRQAGCAHGFGSNLAAPGRGGRA
ncbi:hypothetical protein ACVWZ3_008860 [Bradyrhizobium sp. i1.3.6]